MSEEYSGLEIAIIGIAGRFPGSKNTSELWENLCNGKNLISYFSDNELLESGIPEKHILDSNFVKAKGVIQDVDKFDAEFFGFYPKEVEMLDPQQRLFLECSWEALEDAGYSPDGYEGLVGVFGGVGMNTYLLQSLNSNSNLVTSAEGYKLSIGNDKDFLTTRVSYKLDLKGPSLDIQTACSTSLVATHVACMNLLNYQCDIAIAGGSTISFPHINGYHYQEGMILSPDGVCRPFDKNAGGTVTGNGVGIVVLKRLHDALRDKNEIYAIIKGSAYNNDGAIKVGFTAPGVNGQTEVITSAYNMADVPMSSIGYIETHGTGTSLGDPIEIEALKQAFRQDSNNNQFCAIGSVKSNVGHLDTAAGVTGLIKAALSIYNGKIPPSINYVEPNPKIDFKDSPFYVNTKLKNWENSIGPRRAGVSSFGIGGTNAHIVLEQAPEKQNQSSLEKYHIIPFSAKTKTSLNNIINKFIEYFNQNSSSKLDDLAFTLQTGRKEFENRRFILAKNTEELKQTLIDKQKNKSNTNNGLLVDDPSVVFMFSGQGSQYINMCKELYKEDNNFRKSADECFDICKNELDLELEEIIFPSHNNLASASEKLKQTQFTQPALFVIEYSLAMMLIEFGIRPSIMVGHSIGEFVAACISGVMDLKSALFLVSKRGSLMQRLEKGSMLSVTLSETDLKKILPSNLDLAVINSPNLCVVSGKVNYINDFEEVLTQKKISNAFLHTSHAFHSRMMEPVLEEFKSVVSSIELNPPNIPYMSNVTGSKITSHDATDPNYYVNHLRYTVRFAENILNLSKNENNLFIEVGPGSTLASLAKLNDNVTKNKVVNTVKHVRQNISDREAFLNAIGHLWLYGVKIAWTKFFDFQPSRVHLPTYSFDKKRYWLQTNTSKSKKTLSSKRASNTNDWLYEQSWKRTAFKQINDFPLKHKWLIFDNEEFSISKLLANKIDVQLIRVFVGKNYQKIGEGTFKLSPSSFSDYEKLFDELVKTSLIPDRIVHNWSDIEIDLEEKENYHTNGFLSLMNLAGAIQKNEVKDKLQIDIICSNIFDVTGNENIIPEKATVLGAAKVIHQEIPNLNTKVIDVEISNKSNQNGISNNILSELNNSSNDVVVAFRGNYRWIQIFDILASDQNDRNILLKQNGVYLITGGLGRIGLVFAEYLAKSYNAKIILLDQFNLPPKEEWDKHIKENGSDNNLSPRLKQLLKIINGGADILTLKADVSNSDELKNALDQSVNKFGNINGVIHAAGLVGDEMVKLINQFDISDFEKQTLSKIYGSINLSNLLQNIDMDFVLFQSSLSSILGGIGFSNYSAVNNFIDAFSIKKNRESVNGTKWISVNWDGWNFDASDNDKKLQTKGILPEQGVALLDKILTSNISDQIIVSIEDLNESLDKWIFNRNETEDEVGSIEELYERPNLETEYIEPTSDLEKQIYGEWKKLLGIEKIGVFDNFFDLGGDSLIGTQLVSRMREVFEVDLPLVAIFENATISAIAKLIDENRIESSDSKKMSDILGSINEMSDEEVAQMLKNKLSDE